MKFCLTYTRASTITLPFVTKTPMQMLPDLIFLIFGCLLFQSYFAKKFLRRPCIINLMLTLSYIVAVRNFQLV
uniref:Uncharacterized protein n=1 Tax=Arundo donax TaxID=35708 RepID=A0A0A9HEA2_ARUDO